MLNSNPVCRIMEISPDTARRLIGGNAGNRTVRAGQVRTLVRAIREGRWRVSPDAIAFSGSSLTEPDRLLNGQHRLLACVEADQPIKALVYFNAAEEVYEVCDRQSRRSGADALTVRGFKNGSILSACVSVVWQYRNGGERGALQARPEPDQIRLFVEENPGLTAIVERYGALVRAITRKPAAVLAALYLCSTVDKDLATRFASSITSGDNLKAGAVTFLCRERLISGLRSTARATGGAMPQEFAWVIKAFNAYTQRKTLGVLKWSASENVPRLFGCPFNPPE